MSESQNYNGVLDELLEVESGLTAWEMDFIESLDKQRGRGFTEKQVEILNRIHEKVLG